MIAYPALIGEIAKRSIAKKDIAASIGVAPRTLYKKLRGITPFTWPEAVQIRDCFFSDMSVEELFEICKRA